MHQQFIFLKFVLIIQFKTCKFEISDRKSRFYQQANGRNWLDE